MKNFNNSLDLAFKKSTDKLLFESEQQFTDLISLNESRYSYTAHVLGDNLRCIDNYVWEKLDISDGKEASERIAEIEKEFLDFAITFGDIADNWTTNKQYVIDYLVESKHNVLANLLEEGLWVKLSRTISKGKKCNYFPNLDKYI